MNRRRPNHLKAVAATLGVGVAFVVPAAGCSGKHQTEYCSSPRAISDAYPGDGSAVNDHDQSTWLHGAQITISIPNKKFKLGGVIVGYETGARPGKSETDWHNSNPIPISTEDSGKKETVALGIGGQSVAFSVQITDEAGSEFCSSAATAIPEAVFSPLLTHDQAMAQGWQPVWPPA
ncbi:MAG TPA: hypothetical protein VGO07_07380 [Candidatus Saccharimonadales bacterium]|jgi:hypothetical protein|nr:hypothetical protein [Candidatus Saccharimonadales bacterium]